MDTNEMETAGAPGPAPSRNWKKSWLATGALAAGLAIGAAGVAGAATGSGSSSSSGSSGSSSAPAAPGYGRVPGGQAPSGGQDPTKMANGPGETLLTGDNATKAKDAALAAVPGATVIRVETDSSGVGTYEAHLTKSDGSQVTVLMDSSFKVVSTVDGFGGGPKGQNGPPQGAPHGYGGATTSN